MGRDDSGELPGEDERADVAVGFDALEGAQDDAGDDTDPSGVSQDEGEALDPDEVVLEDAPLPEFVERLMGAGLVSDDLTVAEVTATLGPVYDLDELATSQVEDIVDRLEGVGVQWAIDRAGRLVVHRNDERRADGVIEEVFGPDDDADSGGGQDRDLIRDEVEDLAAQIATAGPISEPSKKWWRRSRG